MTKQEFEAWKRETDRSKKQWVKDVCVSHNRNGLFLYRGGESGSFIEIETDGLVCIGTYEDAFPHIGEALFHETGSHQCDGFDDAVGRILSAVGLQGSIDILMEGVPAVTTNSHT